jgi:ABC-2 type transport system ATP-binding protein
MSSSVETRGLTKHYGKTVAVKDLTLTVEPGEVYGFLGPNGAGKTTTLRMLLGLVRPTSGTLRVYGHPPTARGYLDRVGALIEGPAFYSYLSGRDNLRVVARHAGVGDDRVAAVLESVDLTDRARERYSAYSLGMKQRLGLAAARLKQPELLILDEPTNGLDPAGMLDMRNLIRRLSAQGCTVLLSSHLLGEVQQICDRVGVINRGEMVGQMSVEELGAEGSLVVVGDPLDAAYTRVSSMVGPDRVRRNGDTLQLDVSKVDASKINAELVSAGIAVSELRWQPPDLEQVFFQLTGVNADVA